MSAPTLRALGIDDLDALYALETKAQPLPWSDDQLLLELVNNDARVIGAFVEETLVGHVITRKMVDELWVLNIAVDPAHRRRGYGSALLQSAVQHGRAHMLSSLWLEVREGNVAARMLYGALGFEEKATRPAYYAPLPSATAREGAAVMSRAL